MLNQVVEVGRVCSEVKLKKTKNGTSVVILEIAVDRCFKNKDNSYDKDYINCTLFNGVADNTAEYVKVGDIVGVKGRLARLDKESPLEFVAEKVTFLTSKRKSEA